jgi:hypothetical protein
MQSSKFIGGEQDKFVKLSVLTGWKRKLSLIMHLEIMHLEETHGEVPSSWVPRSKLCAGYDSNSFAPSGDIQCHCKIIGLTLITEHSCGVHIGDNCQ